MANWLTDIFGWSDNKGIKPIDRKSLQKWGDKRNSYLHNQHNYYYGQKKTIKHPFDKYNPEDGGYTEGTTDVVMETDPDSPDFGKRRFRSQSEQGGSSEMTEKLGERETEVHKPISDNRDTAHVANPNALDDIDTRRKKKIGKGDPLSEAGNIIKEQGPDSGGGGWNEYAHGPNGGPLPQAADRGKSQQMYQDFHAEQDAKMRNRGYVNNAMQNDIKTKALIDSLAANKSPMDEVLPLQNKNSQGPNYNKNAKVKYGDKYKDENEPASKPLTSSKYKMPRYDLDAMEGRIDKYNALSVLSASADNAKKINNEDLLPMYFHDLVNKKYIPFRAYINSLSDSFEGKWSPTSYLGRADETQIYNGCGRTFTIDFTAIALSIDELHPMWQRVNHLVGLTKPAAYTNPTAANSGSSFVVPPFVKFNLGDMYMNQPAIITQIGMEIPNEGNWELVDNGRVNTKKNKYEYLNGTYAKDGVKSARYPTAVKLNVSMTFLEKRIPQTMNRHFGDDTVERTMGMGASVNDTDEKEKGSFNHQLVHYPKPKND